jgi:hypothetical protein
MAQEQRSIDFTTFVLSISSAAFMGLGLTPKPGESKPEKDLELARQNIDLLDLMKEKTKNNLTADEQKLLDSLLYETRMRFVEAQKG